MEFRNTEEAFVLASVKEFVNTWASGSKANLNLECQNGQAWVKLAFQLGHPAAPHHVPVIPPHQAQRPRKGPSRRLKDQVRAAAYRAKQLSQPQSAETAANSLNSMPSAVAADLSLSQVVSTCDPQPPAPPNQISAAQAEESNHEADSATVPPPPTHDTAPAVMLPAEYHLEVEGDLAAAQATFATPDDNDRGHAGNVGPAPLVEPYLALPLDAACRSRPVGHGHQDPPQPAVQVAAEDVPSVRDEVCRDEEFYRYLEEQKQFKEDQIRKLTARVSFGFKPNSTRKPF